MLQYVALHFIAHDEIAVQIANNGALRATCWAGSIWRRSNQAARATYAFAAFAIRCASMPISRNCPVGTVIWPQK